MRIHWRRSLSLICVLGAGSLSSCNSQKQPASLSYEDARQNGSRPISPVTIASRLQPETAADFQPEMADTDGTNIPVANELHVVSKFDGNIKQGSWLRRDSSISCSGRGPSWDTRFTCRPANIEYWPQLTQRLPTALARIYFFEAE
jgi:hypothetical protein